METNYYEVFILVLLIIIFIVTFIEKHRYKINNFFLKKRKNYRSYREDGYYDDKKNFVEKEQLFRLTEQENGSSSSSRNSDHHDIPQFCYDKAYRCSDDPTIPCDCDYHCNSKNEFYETVVTSNQTVIFYDEKLAPGRYCLPRNKNKGGTANIYLPECLSTLVYDRNRWRCLCSHPEIMRGESCSEVVACKIPWLGDEKNKDNYLYDFWLQQPLTIQDMFQSDFDFYEKLPNDSTQFRYRCQCNGTDQLGNRLVVLPEVPFMCFSDTCKANIKNNLLPGFVHGKGCDCGDFSKTRVKNELPNDSNTPCTICYNEYNDKTKQLRLKIPCYHKDSIIFDTDIKNHPYPCFNYDASIDCHVGTIPISIN